MSVKTQHETLGFVLKQFCSVPVHTFQSHCSCRILPVQTLEDPVLEQGIHGDWDNCNKSVDWTFLHNSPWCLSHGSAHSNSVASIHANLWHVS